MIRGVLSDTRCGNAFRLAFCLILVQLTLFGDCFNGIIPLIDSACAQEPAKKSISLNDPIFDIQVEGNHSIPALAILQKTKIQRGRPATRDQVLEDVRLLPAGSPVFNLSTETQIRDWYWFIKSKSDRSWRRSNFVVIKK